jgi:homoserine O-acetyltransferase
MELRTLVTDTDLPLESGGVVHKLKIGYHSYGTLNAAKDNVVWVCHALTANSDVSDWWNGLIGDGCLINPEKYFIICANIIGSCYGSSEPSSFDDIKSVVTIRDFVKAHKILAKHLGVEKIKLCLGGSLGGMQVMEWAIDNPDFFESIALIATSAKHSPWGIAFNEAQRMALEHPVYGLETARAIAMLSYRNYETFHQTQTDEEHKTDNYLASSYMRYQGKKLANRFNKDSYYTLSKAMDSHDVGRGRNGIQNALSQIKAKTVVIGISSDILFPVSEQKTLNKFIPQSKLFVIDSVYGHDGFLIETEKLSEILKNELAI